MNKKTRYLLLAVGFVFFLMAAPIIVLFVTGQTYNFETGQFLKTGILAIKAEQKNAQVFLNNKLVRENVGDIKFLAPGEYDLSLRKKDYFDWNKRLSIAPGGVTWAHPLSSKIFMFLRYPTQEVLGQNIKGFYINGDNVYFVGNGFLTHTSINEPDKSENFSLPDSLEKIIPAPNGKTLILTNAAGLEPQSFNTETKIFKNLSSLLTNNQFIFSPSNDLYTLEGEVLYKIDIEGDKKTKLLESVKAFFFTEKNLYYIQDVNNFRTLLVSSQSLGDITEIITNIPQFSSGEIFVNFEKQIFLLLDRRLYKVTSQLELIADNVSLWDFNPGESAIVFFHSGELAYFNPFEQQVNFINRTSQNVVSPKLSLLYNNAFFIADNKVMAMELDPRDRQNEYTLYSAKNATKLVIGSEAKSLFVLDDGNLVMLKVR